MTNSFTSYNQIYDIFEKNSSFLHSKDRFEYSLCVANEKSIDLNKNYLVQDILDTKLLNRKRLYLIKWKNKSTNSWESNEIIRFNEPESFNQLDRYILFLLCFNLRLFTTCINFERGLKVRSE